jgi:hypothetical protein
MAIQLMVAFIAKEEKKTVNSSALKSQGVHVEKRQQN